MADLLYLVHRLPYPPNKGDKVRSFNVLRFLAKRHRVHVGTFIDDPDDERHVEALRAHCASLHVERLVPQRARIASLAGLLTGDALSVRYYRNGSLKRWVAATVERHAIHQVVVFSSAMMQFTEGLPGVTTLLDCVDVDSAKWTQYADAHRWPLSAVYRREGRRLLAVEAEAAKRALRTFFVTEAETELFRRLVPSCASRVEAVGNGVDADYFSPAHELSSPFHDGETPIVFTGAMDYWPNIDAACWFATEILPLLRARGRDVRFYVVGMRPAAAVLALAGPHVVVTGTVPDVRPYIRHAAVVVAPLRIARGIQNKILEAMAMGRPVVASTACAAGIDAERGTALSTATDAPAFVAEIERLLADPAAAASMGRRARARVLGRYSWDAELARIGAWIEPGAEETTSHREPAAPAAVGLKTCAG